MKETASQLLLFGIGDLMGTWRGWCRELIPFPSRVGELRDASILSEFYRGEREGRTRERGLVQRLFGEGLPIPTSDFASPCFTL